MLARFMLLALFVGAIALVITGIVLCVSATSSYIEEGPAWRMTISGWIFGGVGVMLLMLTTATTIVVSLLHKQK